MQVMLQIFPTEMITTYLIYHIIYYNLYNVLLNSLENCIYFQMFLNLKIQRYIINTSKFACNQETDLKQKYKLTVNSGKRISC